MNKILVIMPVYNTEKYVDNAIQSVLQQTHTDLHLVIIDDGSTDNSYEVIKQYESNDRVTVLQNEENRGCYYSRNRGLTYLDNSYRFFTVHDSDDISDIERLERLVYKFNVSSDIILGMKTTYIRVDENYQPIEPRDIYASEGCAIYCSSVHTILGFYDDTQFSGDTDYWWRLERYCKLNPEYRVTTSDEILYLAVSRDDSSNLTHRYKVGTDRQPYMRKIRQEISQMKNKEEFFRPIFD